MHLPNPVFHRATPVQYGGKNFLHNFLSYLDVKTSSILFYKMLKYVHVFI